MRKDVSARFADKNEIDNLTSSGYLSIPSETGNIYYRNHEIAFGKSILFRLINFLWAHEIVVNGARAI